MEPVQGNGTQLDFPDRYYREVRQICSEHGILLIFDEVQTGFGRTGRMWAVEHEGIEPDVILAGKEATIESVEQDYEGRIALGVTIDCDPGKDLGKEGKPGHRFFYAPEEVERIQ